jgi:hypothetical protein
MDARAPLTKPTVIALRPQRRPLDNLDAGEWESGGIRSIVLTCIHYIPHPSEKTDYRETLALR